MNSPLDELYNEDVFQHILQYIDLYDLYQVACLSKAIYYKVNCFCEYEVRRLTKKLLKISEHQIIFEDEGILCSELQDENASPFLPLYVKCKRFLHLRRISAIDCINSLNRKDSGTDSSSSTVKHDELLGRDILLISDKNTTTYVFRNVNPGHYTATIRMMILGEKSLFRGSGSYISFSGSKENEEGEYLIHFLDVTLRLWENIHNFLETGGKSSKLKINEDWVVDQYDKETGWFSLRLLELRLQKCCDLKWTFNDEHWSCLRFLRIVTEKRYDYTELKPLLQTL